MAVLPWGWWLPGWFPQDGCWRTCRRTQTPGWWTGWWCSSVRPPHHPAGCEHSCHRLESKQKNITTRNQEIMVILEYSKLGTNKYWLLMLELYLNHFLKKILHYFINWPWHPLLGTRMYLGRHLSQRSPVTPGRHWHRPVTLSHVMAPSSSHSHAVNVQL